MKTYKDIYKLPLKQADRTGWVYDQNGNFVFQFEKYYDSKGKRLNWLEPFWKKVIIFINEEAKGWKSSENWNHKNGEIFLGNVHVITIRGWGNLCGVGGHNLPAEEAANIQYTFSEFIVNKFNESICPVSGKPLSDL